MLLMLVMLVMLGWKINEQRGATTSNVFQLDFEVQHKIWKPELWLKVKYILFIDHKIPFTLSRMRRLLRNNFVNDKILMIYNFALAGCITRMRRIEDINSERSETQSLVDCWLRSDGGRPGSSRPGLCVRC